MAVDIPGRKRTPNWNWLAGSANLRACVIVPTSCRSPATPGEYTISTQPSGSTGYSGNALPGLVDQKHSTHFWSRRLAGNSWYRIGIPLEFRLYRNREVIRRVGVANHLRIFKLD